MNCNIGFKCESSVLRIAAFVLECSHSYRVIFRVILWISSPPVLATLFAYHYIILMYYIVRGLYINNFSMYNLICFYYNEPCSIYNKIKLTNTNNFVVCEYYYANKVEKLLYLI